MDLSRPFYRINLGKTKVKAAKQKPEIFTSRVAACPELVEGLPSSKLIIILENRDYMAMMKEKLLEIRGFYRNLRLSPVMATR